MFTGKCQILVTQCFVVAVHTLILNHCPYCVLNRLSLMVQEYIVYSLSPSNQLCLLFP